MEAKGPSQRWKMHVPEFKHSGRIQSSTARGGERGGDRGGPNKSVTMAPTSRYLTDRQYVMRKPLFSVEQHTSILKKSHLQEHTQKENQLAVNRGEENQQHTDTNFVTRARADLSAESFSLSHSDMSSPSASREDLDSSLSVSELRARLYHRDAAFGSPPPGSRSARRNLLSSVLEVQRLNPPLRPPLTSTVLYPTYTPRSGQLRPSQTRHRPRGSEGEGRGERKPFASGGNSEGQQMSPHEANYWACAIPKALPPSADRRSAGWDPNREYQALLDYTYPLRPGQVVTEWGSSELHEDSLLQTDPNMQDSGIELDHFCSSASLSGLGFTESSTGQARERNTLSVGQRSPDQSSDDLPSRTLTDHLGLSLDSLDSCQNRGRLNQCKRDGQRHQHHSLSSSSCAAFIRSTSVLPQSRCVCREVDEEFWALPEQLEELQLLSRQVREVSARLSQPVADSWESLGPGTTSILSSITLPEKQEGGGKELGVDSQGTDETDRGEMAAAQMAAGHSSSATVRRSSEVWLEPAGEGLSRSSLKEVEALVEQLCGLTLHSSQRRSQENQEQSDSLMQHIQVFCSHLEQLIQRLYSVSEKMELLASPTVDIGSVKSSLAEYQSFQREVSSHQSLTSSVLQTGQLLLSCINTTSPFLRDTLLLIERQCGALESHTEHFFSSILSAMDTLTQPSPVQQSREGDSGPMGVQGSTQ